MENWLSSAAPKRGPDEHAGHEVEHVLQVGGPRLLDGLLGHDLDAARRPIDLLLGLLLGAGAFRREQARLDHHGRQARRRGLILGERGGGEQPRPRTAGRQSAKRIGEPPRRGRSLAAPCDREPLETMGAGYPPVTGRARWADARRGPLAQREEVGGERPWWALIGTSERSGRDRRRRPSRSRGGRPRSTRSDRPRSPRDDSRPRTRDSSRAGACRRRGEPSGARSRTRRRRAGARGRRRGCAVARGERAHRGAGGGEERDPPGGHPCRGWSESAARAGTGQHLDLAEIGPEPRRHPRRRGAASSRSTATGGAPCRALMSRWASAGSAAGETDEDGEDRDQGAHADTLAPVPVPRETPAMRAVASRQQEAGIRPPISGNIAFGRLILLEVWT